MVTKEIFMLCESTNEEEALQLDKEKYKANRKYDGIRLICIKTDKEVLLMNRRGKECSFHFQEVAEDIKKLPPFTIVDGEVISYDDDFNKLQRRAHTLDKVKQATLQKEIPVKFVMFDILQLNNVNIMNLPLHERVVKLNEMFIGLNGVTGFLEVAEYGEIDEMLRKARSEDREGIIIKDMDSVYESKRSKSWKKLKFWIEKNISVIKYEPMPNNKGITVEDDQGNRVAVLGGQSLELKKLIDNNKKVEINVQALEITKDGRMRMPSFRGLVKAKEESKQNESKNIR
jgi:ATP-dependent DNA ligase